MTARLLQIRSRWTVSVLGLLAAVLAVTGCHDPMMDQPRYEPYEPSDLFEDGRSARMHEAGTIPRGYREDDLHLNAGLLDGKPAEVFPMPVDDDMVRRGRDRYDIFCAPCHDRAGYGRGIVVRRGFRVPPSLHDERLRTAPPGHFVDVMTKGFGAMPSYARQVPPKDRWAIAAYVRALQLSQRTDIASLPAAESRRVKEILR
jgi:mono/diheme cytochrome c family protein